MAASSPKPASPAPLGTSTPGPSAGTGTAKKPAPQRPVAVQATPEPSPAPKPKPSPAGSPDINAKLRALLPNNPINPTRGGYTLKPGSLGSSVEPIPPPEVLAHTQFIFETSKGIGRDRAVKMWVTQVKHGPLGQTCVGWLVRYPQGPTIGGDPHGITILGRVNLPPAQGEAGYHPIVETDASMPCSPRDLVPFTPSPSPSP